jgi:hypothetical protein
MRSDVLERLRAVDPRLLAEIVRQDQRSQSFELRDWTVERLSSQGIINPDALFRFSGHRRAGNETRPWAVVLKILHKPQEEQDRRDLWYWKRELLAGQSQLLERLPGPVRAPRVDAATEHAEGGWLWMEHIGGNTSQSWTPAHYAFAARELGRFNGAYLSGSPLPTDPWLCMDHCRWWLRTLERYHPERAWDNPFVHTAFSEPVRRNVERLRAEAGRFLTVLNQLPQLFSHFDFQRRHLFIRARADGTDEVVAVDWAMVGIGPLGGDLVSLIGASALLFEVEPDKVAELEGVSFDAYRAGLRDAGVGRRPRSDTPGVHGVARRVDWGPRPRPLQPSGQRRESETWPSDTSAAGQKPLPPAGRHSASSPLTEQTRPVASWIDCDRGDAAAMPRALRIIACRGRITRRPRCDLRGRWAAMPGMDRSTLSTSRAHYLMLSNDIRRSGVVRHRHRRSTSADRRDRRRHDSGQTGLGDEPRALLTSSEPISETAAADLDWEPAQHGCQLPTKWLVSCWRVLTSAMQLAPRRELNPLTNAW